MKQHKLIMFLLLSLGTTPAFAAVSLMDKDQWKISMGGFVEMDTIVDSTRSLTEVAGNTAIGRPDTLAGQSGRTQFSIRNSRLSFTIDAPEVDSWKTKAYFEFDLLGFDPSPGTPTGAANSEAGFFNNPTFRARHIYFSGENSGWQILVGQYWELFGWQPYYFIPTIQVAPVAGMAYSRTAMVKAMKTVQLSETNTLQAAVGIARPPERDSSLPDFQAGVRLAIGSRTAGFTGGATGAQKAQPLSVGVSGAFRKFVIPANTSQFAPNGDTTKYYGTALAVDALVPIIPSSDNKEVSNTLMLGGEFTIGKGYGDQFSGWTGNLSSPLNALTTAPERNVNLDAGLGGYDPNGNFSLVKLRTLNAYLQYHLPGSCKTWLTFGYGRLVSTNIGGMVVSYAASPKTSSGSVPYNKAEAYLTNIMHDLSSQIRLGLEYAYMRTTYQDGIRAHDNRYQLSTYFIF